MLQTFNIVLEVIAVQLEVWVRVLNTMLHKIDIHGSVMIDSNAP